MGLFSPYSLICRDQTLVRGLKQLIQNGTKTKERNFSLTRLRSMCGVVAHNRSKCPSFVHSKNRREIAPPNINQISISTNPLKNSGALELSIYSSFSSVLFFADNF